jgi:hypothetical protein
MDIFKLLDERFPNARSRTGRNGDAVETAAWLAGLTEFACQVWEEQHYTYKPAHPLKRWAINNPDDVERVIGMTAISLEDNALPRKEIVRRWVASAAGIAAGDTQCPVDGSLIRGNAPALVG